MRQRRRRVTPGPAVPATLVAPVRGLIENENLAAAGPAGASVLENWFPMQSTIRIRGGAFKSADIGSNPVLSLIPYQVADAPKLFAATAGTVYDVTALDPAAAPVTAMSGLSSGYWSFVQFGTAGGNFLVMANGTNSVRYYDGTAWATITGTTTPGITGVTTSTLSHLWVHGNRVWAVQKNTLNAWYLPVDSIGGAAQQFALGGVFRRGGSLLFGCTWSSDSGDGMDDRCVFVTTEGEIAIYEGTSPSDAASWGLVGRYEIGRPVGSQIIRRGGDVLMATTDGLVALSQVVATTREQAVLSALTAAIEPSWQRAVRTRDVQKPFGLLHWHAASMGLVGLPHRGETFVVNMTTGAWSKFTGWDVQSMCVFNGNAYFGDSLGNVFLVEGGGSDNGAIYVARAQMSPSSFGSPGTEKHFTKARATFRGATPFQTALSAAMNYGTNFPSPPSAMIDDSTPAIWDLGVWDVSRWDDGPDSEERPTTVTGWRTIGRSGFSASAQVQITSGGSRRPDTELISVEMAHLRGWPNN